MASPQWTRGSAPNRTPRVTISVWNVPVGEPHTVRFLGNPFCCFVHGVGRRSLPCVAPSAVCPFCLKHADQIPAGYAPAQMWGTDANRKERWITVVCSLTDNALDKLRDKDLRGSIYRLARKGTAYNAPLLSSFQMQNMIGLPDEFDPVPIVNRIWANYLATFDANIPSLADPLPVEEAIVPRMLLDQIADHMAEDVDQADRARNGKGGVS